MGLRSGKKLTLYFILAGVLTILLTIFADTLLLKELKKSYDSTKSLLSVIAAEGESGDALLKWLKEEPNETLLAAGKSKQSAYGYDMPSGTVWDRNYLAAKKKVILLSACFDGCLLLVLSALFLLYNKWNHERISCIENALCQIQTTETDGPTLENLPLENMLTDRIFSLQKQIQADHIRMQQEKESTKALVTDISHQLKTPVAALKTSLELLSDEDMTDTERQEFFTGCMHQLSCLENLTASLVGVSRMEKGMIQIHPKPSPVKETILSAVSRLYEKAADKQISIEMSEDTCSDTVPVWHDKKWTAEVLVNLLDNAIKYSSGPSKIEIRVEELSSYLCISVSDQGMGIPKEEWHKIFQRFYRGKAVQELEGSGVGLYLAREIMEKQSGTIFVTSKTGREHGSVFSIQLPKA